MICINLALGISSIIFFIIIIIYLFILSTLNYIHPSCLAMKMAPSNISLSCKCGLCVTGCTVKLKCVGESLPGNKKQRYQFLMYNGRQCDDALLGTEQRVLFLSFFFLVISIVFIF
jgi:hypothetical protein